MARASGVILGNSSHKLELNQARLLKEFYIGLNVAEMAIAARAKKNYKLCLPQATQKKVLKEKASGGLEQWVI